MREKVALRSRSMLKKWFQSPGCCVQPSLGETVKKHASGFSYGKILHSAHIINFFGALFLLAWVLCLGTTSVWAEEQITEIEQSSEASVNESLVPETADSELIATPQVKKSKFRGNSYQIKNNITLEPFGLIFGTGTLEYEHMMDRNTSLALGLKFTGPSSEATLDESGFGWKHNAIGLQGAFRFFPLKKFYAPRGLWLGPTVEYIYDYYNDFGTSVKDINVLAEVGWKFILSERIGFVFSPYIGIGYSWGIGEPIMVYEGTKQLAPHPGIMGLLGCAIGIGF